MEKIYSKIELGKLLHIIVRDEDFTPGRTNIIDEDQFLQCSLLNLNKDHTFKPHKHIWKLREQYVIAQESWIVIRGSVKCSFYDINNELLCEPVLRAGNRAENHSSAPTLFRSVIRCPVSASGQWSFVSWPFS